MGTNAFWAEYIAQRDGYDVIVAPADWFKFQVQGPSAIYLLEKLTGADLRGVKYMSGIERERSPVTTFSLSARGCPARSASSSRARATSAMRSGTRSSRPVRSSASAASVAASR